MSASSDCRIKWLDVLKGFLILFIILNHSYPTDIYQRIYSPFFLSMFFFASGYTFSPKKSFGEFIVSKCRRLLIPFLCLGAIRMVIYQVLEGGSIKERVISFLLQINGRGDDMWFLSCLFVCFILMYLVNLLSTKLFTKHSNVACLIISFAVSVVGYLDVSIFHIRLPWEFELACMMLFFMALGYLSRVIKIDFSTKITPFCALGSVFIYTLAQIFEKYNNDIHMEKIENPVSFALLMLTAIFPVLFICTRKLPEAVFKIFVFLGQNTLFLYAFGGFARIIIYPLMRLVGVESNYVVSIVCMIAAPLIMYFPIKLVNRLTPWLVGK